MAMLGTNESLEVTHGDQRLDFHCQKAMNAQHPRYNKAAIWKIYYGYDFFN